MKQVKLTTGEYLLVEVPDNATDFFIKYWLIGPTLFLTLPDPDCGKQNFYEPLSDGQWEIIGRASELREEQWGEIVEELASVPLYKDYTSTYKDCFMATESGLSLIKSHSMNPETTLVIRKIK